MFSISCHTEALKAVVEAAIAGVSVLSLCEKGDAYIAVETGKIFKKEKEMKKGAVLNSSPNVQLYNDSILFPFCFTKCPKILTVLPRFTN